MWLDCRTVGLWRGYLLSFVRRTTQHQDSNQSLWRAISPSQCALSLHCAIFFFLQCRLGYVPETGRWVISGHGNHSAAPAGPNQVFLFFSNQITNPKISVKWNNEHFLYLMRNILFPPSAICVQAADFLSGIVMLKWVPNFFFLFFLFIYRRTDTLIKHNFKSTYSTTAQQRKLLRCDDAGGLLMIHTIQ